MRRLLSGLWMVINRPPGDEDSPGRARTSASSVEPLRPSRVGASTSVQAERLD